MAASSRQEKLGLTHGRQAHPIQSVRKARSRALFHSRVRIRLGELIWTGNGRGPGVSPRTDTKDLQKTCPTFCCINHPERGNSPPLAKVSRNQEGFNYIWGIEIHRDEEIHRREIKKKLQGLDGRRKLGILSGCWRSPGSQGSPLTDRVWLFSRGEIGYVHR